MPRPDPSHQPAQGVALLGREAERQQRQQVARGSGDDHELPAPDPGDEAVQRGFDGQRDRQPPPPA